VVGIFLYVGAEVAIGSFLVNFLSQPDIAGLNEAQASKFIAYYWGGAMVGRFIGAFVMQKIAPGKVLAFNSAMVIILISSAVLFDGSLAMWSLLAVGLFNSIMFPTIFSLALNGLGTSAAQGSGLLCLAIVGGALLPLIQGMLADSVGLQISFVLPMLCYIFIAYYGLIGSKPTKALS
jgi:FHS family L-fucose permease-like MFS transporter